MFHCRPQNAEFTGNSKVVDREICMISNSLEVQSFKTLFTWSGGTRSSGVGFFCFHALADTKQKKPTPLDRGPLLHVNRPFKCSEDRLLLSHLGIEINIH